MSLQLRITLLALALAPALAADDYTDMINACKWANLGVGKYWLLECLEEVFSADPVHLGLNTIAPGAGTVAAGPILHWVPRFERTELVISGAALISTDTSWLFQGQAIIAVPTINRIMRAQAGSPSAKREQTLTSALERDSKLDAKASLTLRTRIFDAKEQYFYGLGPFTSDTSPTEYGLKQYEASMAFNSPLTDWSAAGVNLDFLRPRIGTPYSGVPVQQLYTAASVPGLNLRDNFVRFEPYVSLRFPPRRSVNTVARVGYSFYHDVGDRAFSFQRLSVSSITSIPLTIPTHRKLDAKGFWAFLCQTTRSGQICSLGDLTLTGRMDATYAGAKSQSPFFLDPTLGGLDFWGDATLRGFGDYRFRAPNRVLLQAEYRRPIWAFLGFLAFYDVGKVADQPSDLWLGALRHDIGVGATVSAGKHEIARLYAAFGTGEPTQVHPQFGSLF
jgi:hypothetical protein